MLVAFFAASVFMTFPLVAHWRSSIPWGAGDSLLVTWIMSWDVHALTTDPLRLFEANVFYPAKHALATSVHLIGVIPLFAPFYLASGDPLWSYNAVFVSSYALCGFSSFCLAYYWTRAFWPSVVAAFLFAFAPYRLAHGSHLQLLNFFWAPLALVFLDRFGRTGGWKPVALFAICYWLQVLSDVYLTFMTTLAALVCAVGAGVHRRLLEPAVRWKTLAFVVATVVVLLPFHLPYLRVQRDWQSFRRLDEVMWYTPDVLGYLAVPPTLNRGYARLLAPFTTGQAFEKVLFPGLLFPLLLVIGLVAPVEGLPAERVRRLRRTFGALTMLALVLSLGPRLVAFGHDTRVPLPYLLLYRFVPGWAGMRVPARFVVLALLGGTPLAALGAMWCTRRLSSVLPSSPLRAPVLAAMLLLGLFLVELGWKPLPLARIGSRASTPPVYRWLARERPGPIVELPFGMFNNFRYMFYSTLHWLPLVNGHSGIIPVTYTDAQAALTNLPAAPAVDYAAALGIEAVVVHRDGMRFPWARGAAESGGLRQIAAFGSDTVYGVPEVAKVSSLRGKLITPPWVPAGAPVTLGLAVRPHGGGAWSDPALMAERTPDLVWVDRAGRRVVSAARFALPLALGRRQPRVVPLAVQAPAAEGEYEIRLEEPGIPLALAPRRLTVRGWSLATSLDGPAGLAARYVADVDRDPLTGAVRLSVTARNVGQAIWLARTPDERGEVRLAWQWLAGGKPVRSPGRVDLVHDVFPGQRVRFDAVLDPPWRAGTYELELRLVSELVSWFPKRASPPVRRLVDVPPRRPA